METRDIWLILIISSIVLILSLNLADNKKVTTITEEKIIKECSNKTLIKTVHCVNDYHKDFYKYVPTDDSKSLTFEQLRDIGGDCRDHTLWNEKILNELNYNKTQVVRLVLDSELVGNTTYVYGHVILAVNDKENYCIIDATDIYCKTTRAIQRF